MRANNYRLLTGASYMASGTSSAPLGLEERFDPLVSINEEG